MRNATCRRDGDNTLARHTDDEWIPLVTAGAIRLKHDDSSAKYLLAFGLFFSSFRYNGLPTLAITSIFLIMRFPKKRLVVSGLLIIILGLVTSSTLDSELSGPVSTQSDGLINWMRYDLSCYAANSNDEVFKNEFGQSSLLEEWRSKSACAWFNDSKNFYQRTPSIDKKVKNAWMHLFTIHPTFIIETHLKRNAYLNPIPLYGLPSMPFIHTTIEFEGKGIKFFSPVFSERLRIYPRVWNYFNFIFGWAGFWLLIIFIFAIKGRNSIFFGIGILGLILNLGIFIFAIIPDGRFSLFVLIAGQLILLSELIKWIRMLQNIRRIPLKINRD